MMNKDNKSACYEAYSKQLQIEAEAFLEGRREEREGERISWERIKSIITKSSVKGAK